MGIFKKLFGKPELQDPLNFSVFKADMHSHLIPGIDDGATDLENSIQLISGLQQLGFKKIVTTPHIMSDYYKNDRDTILTGRDLVVKELEKRGMGVGFNAAAEYYLDAHFESLINQKKLLTFGANYVLFELSFLSEPVTLQRAVFNMQLAGYQPVLAHPERYTYWHSSPERYNELSEKGLLLQLNINALAGIYSPKAKKIAEYLVDQEIVDFVGTDCHNIQQLGVLQESSRSPYLHKLAKSGRLLNQDV